MSRFSAQWTLCCEFAATAANWTYPPRAALSAVRPVLQLPTYFAYTVRAVATSSVPPMIARPSGKMVSSYCSTFSRSRNGLRVTWPTPASLPGELVERDARAGVASTARRCGRRARPCGCPRLPASQGNSPCLHVGQSTCSRSDETSTCRMRLSQSSTTVRLRETASRLPLRILIASIGLDRRDHADDRAEDAGRVAGGRAARRRDTPASGTAGTAVSPGRMVIVCPSAPRQPP